MPSKLPYIQVRTQADTITKMKCIAETRNMSLSKAVEEMVLDEIARFEKEYGAIEIYQMNTEEIIQDLKKRVQKKPPYGDNV